MASSDRTRATDPPVSPPHDPLTVVAESLPFEREWRERFIEFATLHENDAGIAGWSLSGLETRLRFFDRHWRPPLSRALYLDAGCGAGTYARSLSAHAVDVVGLDYSMPTLLKAQQRSPQSINFCAGDASRLPFRDATFDGALCFGLLQAVSDSTPVVAELARVLKPGAELWIDALNRGGLASRIERARLKVRGKGMHLRYESRRQLATVLKSAGFGDLQHYWLPLMPSQLLRLQPLAESRVMRAAFANVPSLGATFSHAFVFRAVRRS